MSDSNDLREGLAGSLRARDVRRFFVEVMVAAMNADGHVDQRELDALAHILDAHELFCSLPPRVADQLMRTATDALEFAADIYQRIPVISRSLIWRGHRVFAFAMACEVVAADGEIDGTERSYLEALRAGFMLSRAEHDDLLHAAPSGAVMTRAELIAGTVERFVAPVINVSLVHGLLLRDSNMERLQRLLCEIPDFQRHRDLIIDHIHHLPTDLSDWNVQQTLSNVAHAIPEHADRYWVVTYALVVDALSGKLGLRAPYFAATLQRAFGLSQDDMAAALAHAAAMTNTG